MATLEEHNDSAKISGLVKEDDLRTALDSLSVPLLLVMVDTRGNESIPYMSKGCQLLCNNLSCNDKMGPSAFWAQIHNEDQMVLQQLIQQAAQTLADFCFVYRHIGDKNVLRWIKLKASFQKNDNPACAYSFYAFLQDITEQKRAEAVAVAAEQVLVASGRGFKQMAGEVPRTLLNCKKCGGHRDWLFFINNQCEAIFEKREEVLHDWKAAWEPVHPEDVPQLKGKDTLSIVQKEDLVDLRHYIARSPGKGKWLQAKSVLLAEGDDMSQARAEMMYDSSFRKEMEESLAKTESQLKAALLDPECMTMRRRWPHPFFHPQCKDDRAAHVFGHAWRSIQSTTEHNTCSPPCSPPPLSHSPYMGLTSKTTISLLSMRNNATDNSGVHFARELAKQLEAELQLFADAIPGGVFKIAVMPTGEKKVVFVNKGAEDLLGVPASRLKCDFSLLWKHDALDLFEQGFAYSVETQNPLSVKFQSLVDGTERWIHAQAVSQPKTQDGSQEWTGILVDVTAQEAIEDMLKQAKFVAEEANSAKGRFLANMSHEIRTPMNAIIGMGRLLLETTLSDEQREFATTMQSSAEALLVIINDILDFSKIAAGKMELEKNPFNLLECVESCLDCVAPDVSKKGLELCFAIDDTVPLYVVGDVSRVRQILLNLLGNASKFTEHGSITVSVTSRLLTTAEVAEVDTTWVGDAGKGGLHEIHFSVADTGIGIPPERHESLFKAFSQLDVSTTRKYGGTGLGLAISSWLCALQKGFIWVESEPDAEGHLHGATFHFTILAPQAPQSKNIFTEFRERMETCVPLQGSNVCIVKGRCGAKTAQTLCDQLLSLGMRAVITDAVGASCLIREGPLRPPEMAAEVEEWEMGPSSSGAGKGEDQRSVDEKSSVSCQLERKTWDLVIVDQNALEDEGSGELQKLLASGNSGRMEITKTAPQTPCCVLTSFGQCKTDQHFVKKLGGAVRTLSKPVKSSRLLDFLERTFMGDSGVESPAKKSAPVTVMDMTMGLDCPLKILVAEDNLVNQRVICQLLLKLGYTADVVGDGAQAVEAVTCQRYDAVLMDCCMPVMDGLQATKIIKQTVSPSPIIVAVTAGVLDEDRNACTQAGMDMHISKPILVEELVQKLLKVWERSKQHAT